VSLLPKQEANSAADPYNAHVDCGHEVVRAQYLAWPRYTDPIPRTGLDLDNGVREKRGIFCFEKPIDSHLF